MIRSLQEENGLIKKEIVWNRAPKSSFLTPVLVQVSFSLFCNLCGSESCTICNLLATFSLWTLMERRGTLTVHLRTRMISCLSLKQLLEYVWNWAKEAILVTSQKIRVSHYPQICKWASSLAYCTLALHVESIGGKEAWGYIIFFPGFYFSFFFSFAMID